MREKATAPACSSPARARPVRPIARSRFLGVAGGKIAFVVRIERDDDVIGDVHKIAAKGVLV